MTVDTSPTAPSREASPRGKALGRLIGRIRAERDNDRGPSPIGPGGVAELRRLRPDKPDWLALPLVWQLVAEIEDCGVEVPDRDVPAWALLMAGMARMTPHHAGGERKRLGTVLAEAEFPETRFLRLVRQDPRSLAFADNWSGTTQWLRLKARPIDWHSAWHLLFDTGERAELTRRHLARDFYRAKPRDAA